MTDTFSSDTRPLDCRLRLRDEGKAYPKSGCTTCRTSLATGLRCPHEPTVAPAAVVEPQPAEAPCPPGLDIPDDEFGQGVELFVRESNHIEGIARAPSFVELAAHHIFLGLEVPTLFELETFVRSVQPDGRLRSAAGINVSVGVHIPPAGGPGVGFAAMEIMARATAHEDPWQVHVDYETLHPFTDGNGRSGRVLWLWQMLHGPGRDGVGALARGFLHDFYYQTLRESRS